jgi:hypothetical protein
VKSGGGAPQKAKIRPGFRRKLDFSWRISQPFVIPPRERHSMSTAAPQLVLIAAGVKFTVAVASRS